MPNYGVIDLGSNTVRLCVYDVKSDDKKTYSKKDFRTIINNKAMAGLAAHVRDGVFTEQGIAHALDVLAGHAKRLKYFDCKRTDVFATAVLRNCVNSAEAIARIEEQSGFTVTLLSEKDEAHLGFVGATSDRTIERGTLIDIGGGSTELTRVTDGVDHDNASIGQGSLSSFSNCVRAILPTETEMRDIAATLSDKLAAERARKRYRADSLYGIGGSLRAAAKMYAEMHKQDKRPEVLTASDIDCMLAFCLSDPDTFAHTALKAAPDRIHTLVPGCLLIRQLMEELGASTLTICKKGVREGYLIERMLSAKATAPAKEYTSHDAQEERHDR